MMTDVFNEQFLLEQQLGKLALEFRGCQCEESREGIAKQYEEVVKQLIKSGNWNEVPNYEDQLPDERMPQEFKDHWEELAKNSQP